MDSHFIQNSCGIKKIVDCKVENGQQLFKVKWEPTWEPADNLVTCQHLVDEFWSRVNLLKKNEEKAKEYKRDLKIGSSYENNMTATKLNRLSEESKRDVDDLVNRTSSTSTDSFSLNTPSKIFNSLQENDENKILFKDKKPIKSGDTTTLKSNGLSPSNKTKGSAISGLKYIENFENPYVKIVLVCKICNKEQSLKQSGHWKQHFMTHSDQKPHICSICGKGFVRPLGLRNHIQTNHCSQVKDSAGVTKDLLNQ